MSLSRKRKKQLRKLQKQANTLWESQQVLMGEAAHIARDAGHQLGNYGREQVKPAVQHSYEQYAAPYVDKSVRATRKVYNGALIPAAGAVVGGALSVWDAANDTRSRLASGRGVDLDISSVKKKAAKYGKKATKKFQSHASIPEPKKKGIGAGGVIAIILGVSAAAGVLYAAWQTLRADDELWVADDPLRAPDA
ncbi:DNA helicase [Microbacterium radiodurans]|uniref:DNA helicase n=1 Tax=Microbacterium radiodurans TaxID=661398 RepID=A0A5J5IVU7_9MICO|nr:DNA helicase [Microbacterium radiodurans]KAA9089261.1 DNA helicase [Microbacterium radiodurans]